ncbi:MAG: ABC transporter permease, partial [Actinomycetia bacterium]|nr:ABC transporter permease [Actinomycetes bacterium]
VGFISGLTRGLANETTSAIDAIDADRIVFADTGEAPSYADSTITKQQSQEWASTDGVSDVEPFGLSTVHAGAGDRQETIAAFGVRPSASVSGAPAPQQPGTVVVSEPAADALGVDTGDSLKIAGKSYDVDAVSGDAKLSHLPVVWMSLPDWRSDVANSSTYASVLAISGTATGDEPAGTTSVGLTDSYSAIGSFEAENGSLTMMTVMLYAISALVVGAFFVVWTLQRSADLAVLKALGAATPSLIRGTLGQALIVVIIGVSIGLGITALAAAVIGDGLPFVLDASTTLLPGVAMTILGLVGAAASVRTVTSSDPLQALNRNV